MLDIALFKPNSFIVLDVEFNVIKDLKDRILKIMIGQGR